MSNLGSMNRLKIYLTTLLIFFLVTSLFSQNEKQLLIRFKRSKNQNEKVISGVNLMALYGNTNAQKKAKILQELKKTNKEKLGLNASNILNLTLAEELLSKNNLEDFNSLFRTNLLHIHFDDLTSKHRKSELQSYFAFVNQNTDFIQPLKNDLELTLKSRKNKLIAESFQYLSKAYSWKNEKDSALVYASKAVLFAKRSDSKITLANAFRNFASIHLFFQDYESALFKALEFLQVAKELENDFLTAQAYREIACISMSVGNFEEATIYLNRTLQLSSEVFSDFERGIIYLDLAKNNINLGNLRLAKNNLKLSENIFKKYKSNEYQAKILFLKGLLETTNQNRSCAYLNEAMNKFEKTNTIEGIIETSYYLAKAYKKLNQLNQAEIYINRAINESNKLNLKSIFSTKNKILQAQIFESKGKIKEAYRIQKMLIESNNDYSIRKEAVKIAQLTESNLREEREQLIAFQKDALEKEKKLKESLEMQRTKNFLIAGFIAVLFVLGIIILFLRLNQIRLRQEQREAEMSQTLLRTQMNPHFVFNAMSVIQSYIFTHNPERSSKFLVNFSKLMRLILENSPKEFIPLELEAEILEKYLNTQKMRFEDRFDFEINFDDNLLFKNALVPPMITQPFVENAIEHGQLHTIAGGKIKITAREENGMLLILVQDNGIGRKNSAMTQKIKKHKSMAIDITRERIAIINRKYKTSGNLSFEDIDKENENGTIVKILLPLQFEN